MAFYSLQSDFIFMIYLDPHHNPAKCYYFILHWNSMVQLLRTEVVKVDCLDLNTIPSLCGTVFQLYLKSGISMDPTTLGCKEACTK